jgi:hypothetical protein
MFIKKKGGKEWKTHQQKKTKNKKKRRGGEGRGREGND